MWSGARGGCLANLISWRRGGEEAARRRRGMVRLTACVLACVCEVRRSILGSRGSGVRWR